VDLSILIIFSKEEEQMLIDCLSSVYQSIGDLSFEVILVNNGGKKLDFLKRSFINLIIIENEKNFGVSKARNQAYRSSQGDVIFFIDADIIVENNGIEKMFKYLIDHPDIDGLAPKLVSLDGRLQHNFGFLPSWRYPFYEMINIPVKAGHNIERGFTEFLGGGCLMLKRNAWERVGPYDEKYFYGFEDTDWCVRAKEKGIKLYYFPEAKMVHYTHQGVKLTGTRQVDFYLSEIYYFRKHFGKPFGFITKLFIIVFSFLRIFVSFFKKERKKTRELCWKLIRKSYAEDIKCLND
jgi:GT2 family glycosyltransferase